jgi:hypothetical protein
MDINTVINNPDYGAVTIDGNQTFRDIFKLPKEEMCKLSSHPKASVRLAAVLHAPLNDLPLFISDPDPDVRNRVSQRLK